MAGQRYTSALALTVLLVFNSCLIQDYKWYIEQVSTAVDGGPRSIGLVSDVA